MTHFSFPGSERLKGIAQSPFVPVECPTMLEFSASEARRIALNAQGFGSGRPKRADRDGLRRVVNQTQLIQIDSVNVLARAHYLPFFSRLGPYQQSWLDELAYRDRGLFEQWGHAASFIPTEHYPLFQHRMENGHRWWRARLSPDRRAQFERMIHEVRERGPVTVSDVETEGRRQGWWQWSDAKMALEWNFAHGRLAVRERRNFARVYDLPERVFDPSVLARPGLAEVDAHRDMVRLAAGAMGIATASDLADYYRIPVAAARQRARELVAAGTLEEARVEGWRDTGYLASGTEPVEDVSRATALLSPFDPLLWNRDRTERLFGFYYRIEIYVPAAQRVHGYYVLPFLMDGDLAGRVDLKADRKVKTLVVQGAFAEPGRDRRRVAAALNRELKLMARWLELERIEVVHNGDVAVKLASGAV